MPNGVNQFTTSTNVQNLIGTGSKDWTNGNPYQIPKLKQKYQELSGSRRSSCVAEGCGEDYTATAHVLINDGKKGGGGNKWWLIPLCAFHNSPSREPFWVDPSTRFVGVTDLREEYNC